MTKRDETPDTDPNGWVNSPQGVWAGLVGYLLLGAGVGAVYGHSYWVAHGRPWLDTVVPLLPFWR